MVDRHPLPHLVEDQPRPVGRDAGAELVLGTESLEGVSRECLVEPGVTDLDEAHPLQGGASLGRDDEFGQQLAEDAVLLALDLVLLLALREPALADVSLVQSVDQPFQVVRLCLAV